MITHELAEVLLCRPLLQGCLCTCLIIPLFQIYPHTHAEDRAHCLHCVGRPVEAAELTACMLHGPRL